MRSLSTFPHSSATSWYLKVWCANKVHELHLWIIFLNIKFISSFIHDDESLFNELQNMGKLLYYILSIWGRNTSFNNHIVGSCTWKRFH